MGKQLRDYQQKAIDAVYANLKKGIKKNMLVMATGTGKSLTAVKAITPFKKRLWITNTEELLAQSGTAFLKEMYPDLSIEKMIESYGGLFDYISAVKKMDMFSDMPEMEIVKNIGLVKAEAFDIEADVVMASAQTLWRRLDKMPADMFDAIVADEAHYFMSKTYIQPLKHFDPKLLLTLTATPWRSDGASLSEIADTVAFEYNILDGINDGYLTEFDAIQIQTQLTLDDVRTTAGEFNQKDLKQVVDVPARNQLLLDSYLKYANGTQNIIFGVDIEHCKNIYDVFTSAGQSAEILVGDTDVTPDRKGTINRFKSGETTHLINVTIASTGFDHPNIGCITPAAPTKSLSRYMQELGRGTRPLAGTIDGINNAEDRRLAIRNSNKQKCIVLDMVDNSTKHRLINAWSLDREKPAEKRIFTTQEKKIKLIEERQRREFLAQTNKDKKINLFALPTVKYSTSLSMKDPATEKQLIKLKELGYDVNNQSYTKADANRMISDDDAPKNWIYVLKQKKYDVSKGVTRAQAIKAFEEIRVREQKAKEKKELGNDIAIDGL